MEQLLKPQEAADLIGVSVGALTQMRYDGNGPAYKRLTAKTIRYTLTDIQRWVDASTRTSTAEYAGAR
jgi:hypothetical protein